jgi:hypothetical protein
MATTSLEVLGTVRPDGTLELDKRLNVSPGRVKVRVESIEQSTQPSEGLVEFVQRLRQEMEAAGSHFMNDDEVTAWVEELRSEEDRVEAAYRQEEDKRQ